MKIFFLLLTLFLAVGCSKDSNSGSPALSPQGPAPSPGPGPHVDPTPQALKPFAGVQPSYNQMQGVNLAAGNASFEFTYQPEQDETLTLIDVKPGTLIGCANSDISFDFKFFRTGADGKIDLSAYEGLGGSPVAVQRGQRYLLRVTLMLEKSCLGIIYDFAIRSSR